MRKVRYSRLWGLGNFENEKAELEEEFSDDIPYSEALSFLMDKVTKDHETRVEMRKVISQIDAAKFYINVYEKGDVYSGASQNKEENAKLVISYKKDLASFERRLRKLNKELLGE
jgi:hypothetical protein